MRSFILLAIALAAATATIAQDEAYHGDAALTYQWMRTNAAPGECGCFGLNGVGLSGSWNIHSGWSLVGEFSSEFRASTSNQDSLTVTSFLAGARYRIPQPWIKGTHRPQPLAQFLIGPAHAGGGEAGVANGNYAFASRLGGGIDVPLKSHFDVRAFQVEWFRTQFANAKNDRQNNLLISAGFVYHWSHSQ